MPFTVDQKQANGSLIRLFPYREYQNPGLINLNISYVGNSTGLLTPLAPTASGTQPTRTTATINWTASDNTGRPAITEYRIYRESTGSPVLVGTVGPTIRTFPDSGLPTATPEIIFRYNVYAVNADGVGDPSNTIVLQWNQVLPPQPIAPTNFARESFSADGVSDAKTTLTWSHVTDTTVTKQGIFEGTTLVRDDIGANVSSYEMTGLQLGTTHTNVNVRRFNGWSTSGTTAGWSSASSPQLNFTVSIPPPSLMMTGVSDSAEDSGGTLVWNGWRAYTKTKMMNIANRTGANQPRFICYSIDGAPLGSGQTGDPMNGDQSYAGIKAFVKDELDDFYYNGPGQTRSTRWGIRLYWSTGGNENSDKAYLATNNATNAATYVTLMRASHDAAHLIDPITGTRRYPDAFVGSNPTQEHERKGLVAWWLHPSAQYHDFVVWSMYPPGRGVNDTTLSRNPRVDWPFISLADESRRNNIQPGFLMRCFYRTKQAEAQARIDRGEPDFHLIIGCGETGQASDPDNRGIRPYYAVHGLIGSMFVLAGLYELPMDFACWWDNKTAEEKPHNALSDEPPISDHLSFGGGGAAGNNATATNPSTREAWQNWRDYDHRRGGVHPAQWNGFPASISNFAEVSGTPI